MSKSTHIVGRVKLEVEVPTKESARWVFNHTKHWVQEHLSPMLDEFLSKTSTSDQLIKIDRLVLDVSELRKDNFYQELTVACRNALESYFSQQAANHHSVQNPQEWAYEAVKYFFEHGRFPWWIPTDSGSSRLSSLIRQIPAARLVRLIKVLPSTSQIESRVVQQIPATVRPQLMQHLLQQHANRLKRLAADFKSLHPLAPLVPQQRFNRILEESLFKIALQSQVKSFANARDAAVALIRMLADALQVKAAMLWHHFNIVRQELGRKVGREQLRSAFLSNEGKRRLISGQLQMSSAVDSGEMGAQRSSRQFEHWMDDPTQAPPYPFNADMKYQRKEAPIATLRYFLKAGYLLYTDIIQSMQDLEEWLVAQVSADNQQLASILAEFALHDLARRRLYQQFETTTFHAIIRLLAKGEGEFAMALHASISNLYQTSGAPPSAAIYLAEALLYHLAVQYNRPQGLRDQLEENYFQYLVDYTPSPIAEKVIQQLNEEKQWGTDLDIEPFHQRLVTKRQVAEQAEVSLEQVIAYLELKSSADLRQETAEVAIAKLIEKNDVEFRSWLSESIKQEQHYQRWSQILSGELIQDLLKFIAGGEWEQFQSLQMDLAVLHWDYLPPKTSASLVESSMVLASFNTLASAGSKSSLAMVFWEHYLVFLSGGKKSQQATFASTYLERAEELESNRQLSGPLIIAIRQQAPARKEPQEDPAEPEVSEAIQAVFTYLLEGSLSKLPKTMSVAQISRQLDQLDGVAQEQLWVFIQEQRPVVIDRLLQLASEAAILKLISGQSNLTKAAIESWQKDILAFVKVAIKGMGVELSRKDLLQELLQVVRQGLPIRLYSVPMIKSVLSRVAERAGLDFAGLRDQLAKDSAAFVRENPRLELVLLQLFETMTEQETVQTEQWLEVESSGQDKSSASLDLVEYWLNTEEWPWWGAEQNASDVVKVALDKEVKTFWQLIQRRWTDEKVRRRLIALLSDEQLAKLLKHRYGAYVDFILASRTLAQQQFSVTDGALGRYRHWATILSVATAQQTFSSSTFLNSWLEGLAKTFGRTPELIAYGLQRSPKSPAENRIQELLREWLADRIGRIPDQWISGIIAEHKETIKEVWLQWKDPPQRLSIITSLPDRGLQTLLKHRHAGVIAPLVRLRQWSEQIIQLPSNERRHVSWLALLTAAMDLTVFDWQRFVTKWVDELVLVLKVPRAAVVAKLLTSIRTSTKEGGFQQVLEALKIQELTIEEQPSTTAVAEEATSEDEIQPTTLAASLQEQVQADLGTLRYFFLHGSLSYADRQISRQQLRQKIEFLMDRYPQLLLKMLRQFKALKVQEAVGRRLSMLLPKPGLIAFYQIQLGTSWETVQQIWADFFHLLPGLLPVFRKAELNQWLYKQLFSLYERSQKMPGEKWEHFLSLLFEALVAKESLDMRSFVDAFSSRVEEDQAQLSVIPTLWEKSRGILRTRKQISRKPSETMDDQSAQLEEAIYIHNAGLVLVAPFLNRYFQTLEMLVDRSFPDVQVADRAVHLLQYLASNQTENSEDLLVFNKILCGLPLETPVSAGIEITQEERDLSDFLLRSVLQNWDMMKNSSVENLQGAFLIREGRLVEEDDRWLLSVEAKPYDITLTTLPWTYTMVMLPWMSKRVEVDWKPMQ